MTSHPCFVPGDAAPLGGVVHLPEGDDLLEPAVVMLPGLEAERIRIGGVKDAADRLAHHGHPVLRLDHPGSGTSPGANPPRSEVTNIFNEATNWFLHLTGSRTASLGGVCAGGSHGIRIAGMNDHVAMVVVQGGRLRQRVGKERPTIAAGLAAVDLLERVPRPRSSTRGSSGVYAEEVWSDEQVETLRAATRHAEVVFVFGDGDPGAEDVDELRRTGPIPSHAKDRIHMERLDVDRANTVQDARHDDALVEVLVRRLANIERTPHG